MNDLMDISSELYRVYEWIGGYKVTILNPIGMKKKAAELNIVINPHWLNIMNRQDHNKHLSIGEYRDKKRQWAKIRRQWNVDKFISEVLMGRKERFRNL